MRTGEQVIKIVVHFIISLLLKYVFFFLVRMFSMLFFNNFTLLSVCISTVGKIGGTKATLLKARTLWPKSKPYWSISCSHACDSISSLLPSKTKSVQRGERKIFLEAITPLIIIAPLTIILKWINYDLLGQLIEQNILANPWFNADNC